MFVFALFFLACGHWLIFADENAHQDPLPQNLGDMGPPPHLHQLPRKTVSISAGKNPFFFPGHPLVTRSGRTFSTACWSSATSISTGPRLDGDSQACAATGFALYEWGGAFTLAAFLFNGGRRGLRVFFSALDDQGLPGRPRLRVEKHPLAMFVTQRGCSMPSPPASSHVPAGQIFREKPGASRSGGNPPLQFDAALPRPIHSFSSHSSSGCWLGDRPSRQAGRSSP